MLQVNLERIIELLREFAWSRNDHLQIILLGGLALQHYGMKERVTVDIDAEIKGDLEGVFNYLKTKNIPADMSENIAGWSIIAMPSGYQERSVEIYKDEFLKISVLHFLDFIIAKLRRFSEEDIQDALFVARKYNVKAEEIKKISEEVIKNSPKDTALFIFRKNVDLFIGMLER